MYLCSPTAEHSSFGFQVRERPVDTTLACCSELLGSSKMNTHENGLESCMDPS